jgi:hypothetical protein
MKPSRFTEEQIMGILREQEAGRRRLMWAASMGLAPRRSTHGRPGTVASSSRMPSGSARTRRPPPACRFQLGVCVAVVDLAVSARPSLCVPKTSSLVIT